MFSVEGTAEKIGYFATFEAGYGDVWHRKLGDVFWRFVVGCKDTCQKVRAL